jgi:ubiquinone biosynthesis protein Coq4
MNLRDLRNLHRFWKNPYDAENAVRLILWVSGWTASHLYAGLYASRLASSVELERLTRQLLPVDRFQQMPEGTLGREFLEWYRRNGLDWEHMTAWTNTLSQHGAWPIARFGKLHDIQHLVTGIPTTKQGEIELQGMTIGMTHRTGRPDLFALMNMFAVPFLSVKSGEFTKGMMSFLRGIERGRCCEDLLLFPYENYWDHNLEEVRDLLGITRRNSC